MVRTDQWGKLSPPLEAWPPSCKPTVRAGRDKQLVTRDNLTLDQVIDQANHTDQVTKKKEQSRKKERWEAKTFHEDAEYGEIYYQSRGRGKWGHRGQRSQKRRFSDGKRKHSTLELWRDRSHGKRLQKEDYKVSMNYVVHSYSLKLLKHLCKEGRKLQCYKQEL